MESGISLQDRCTKDHKTDSKLNITEGVILEYDRKGLIIYITDEIQLSIDIHHSMTQTFCRAPSQRRNFTSCKFYHTNCQDTFLVHNFQVSKIYSPCSEANE